MKNLTLLSETIYQQGYFIWDDFLSTQDHYALLQMASQAHLNGHFKKAGIGLQQKASLNPAIRSDHIQWLGEEAENDGLQAYFSAINTIKNHLNQTLFLGLQTFETHFAVYSPGTFYKRHIDQFATADERRISCVYYLNDSWEPVNGGLLNLFNNENQMLTQIVPHGNRFVCFTSDMPHEVTTTLKTRYSIAGWLKVRKV